MKRSDIDKLRAKSVDDLKAMIGELREGMLKARISHAVEGKQVGVQYRQNRRQIARISTILTQKTASGKKT